MKRLIPFWMLPAAWGLKGKSRDIAEAEYYYEGEELERRLAEIECSDDENAKKLAYLEIDKKYDKISDEDYDFKYIDLAYEDQQERELATLEAKIKHGKISNTEYEKEKANLNHEPWVGVINDDFDIEEGINGFSFELDWNEYFIKFLIQNDYGGDSEEQIVQQWFEDVSNDQLEQMYEEEGEEVPMQHPDFSIPKTNISRESKDGKTHYS